MNENIQQRPMLLNVEFKSRKQVANSVPSTLKEIVANLKDGQMLVVDLEGKHE